MVILCQVQQVATERSKQYSARAGISLVKLTSTNTMAPTDRFNFSGLPRPRDYPSSFSFGDHKFGEDDSWCEGIPKAVLIFFICVGTIFLIGFITSMIWYCCAGCELYKRYRSGEPHSGGTVVYRNNPHIMMPQPHQPQWNGVGPPPYPVQPGTPHKHPYSTPRTNNPGQNATHSNSDLT